MKEIAIVRIGDHPVCTYTIGERNVGDEDGLVTYLRSESVSEERITQALEALKKEGTYTLRLG